MAYICHNNLLILQQISFSIFFYFNNFASAWDNVTYHKAGIFFGVLKFRPNPNGIKVTFFPIKKKIPIFKKNFFLKFGIFIQSTHTSYIVMFSFNLMSIVCVIANLFFIDQKWHTVELHWLEQAWNHEKL